jgi:hypothetical protein
MAGTHKLKAFVDQVSARIDDKSSEVPPWVKRVAILTGLLAALSGFLAVRATILTNDAIYASGQAILAQTQSSDAWSEYQADSVKARIVETALLTGAVTGANRAILTQQAKDLRARQPALKTTAQAKATARDQFLQGSLRTLRERDWLGYANFIAQIGIALASVAALLREQRILFVAASAGGICVVMVMYAYAMHLGLTP